MHPAEIYDHLIASHAGDAFDAHVLASILSLGAQEVVQFGDSISEAVGLDDRALVALLSDSFPRAGDVLPGRFPNRVVARGADEAALVDLLQRCATTRSALELRLAAMVARRAQRPNHLWQDLGLQNRTELNLLMRRHFMLLASRNFKDMKWKKFLYRTICRDVGYSLCTAPSCRDCDDFDFCFGDESGESLLARTRRSIEAAP